MKYTEFIDAIVRATKEEEIRKAYTLRFNLPTTTSFRCDFSCDKLIIEFKLDRDFKNLKLLAKTVAQVLYYVRAYQRLRKSKPIPAYFLVASRMFAAFSPTEPFLGWLRNKDYNWQLPASRPDPQLVEHLSISSQLQSLRLFSITDPKEHKLLMGLLKVTLIQE